MRRNQKVIKNEKNELEIKSYPKKNKQKGENYRYTKIEIFDYDLVKGCCKCKTIRLKIIF